MKYVLMIAIFILLFSCSKEDKNNNNHQSISADILMVGVNKNIITPPEDQMILMSGYSDRTEPFNGIHDNLFVRSIVIEDKDTGIHTIHISLDMLNIGSDVFYEVYQEVNDQLPQLELEVSNLFISATHTHGGPSVHTVAAETYKEDRTNLIVQSIIDAYNNKKEAKMRVGSALITDVNSNRQFPHSSGDCDLDVYLEGNSDKESQFIEFVDLEDNSIASMITFGVHSTVMGLHNRQITGDLAGYASRHIENTKGNNHVSLFLYTGGGDQSPVVRTQDVPFINDPETGVKAFGDLLGSQVISEFVNGSFVANIDITTATIPLVLDRDYEPKDDISDGTETRALYAIKYTDELVFVSTPFELFSSTVQAIKSSSTFEHTFLLSLTNGVAHYIPPKVTYLETVNYDHQWQCYENRTSIFTSTAEATFRSKCLELINGLD